jgi:hypothetical protein
VCIVLGLSRIMSLERLIISQCAQALHELPRELVLKLCKGMQLQHVPQDGIICEEDGMGDCMYIVVAGACTVRAQPPPAKPQPAQSQYCGSVVHSTMAQPHAHSVGMNPEDKVCMLKHFLFFICGSCPPTPLVGHWLWACKEPEQPMTFLPL